MATDAPYDKTDEVISNVFGILGAVCWSVQLIPQIILNYRRHSASGLSPTFMLFWVCAGIPLGVYNIVQHFNIALQVQPQILTSLSLLTWAQCYYYERKWSLTRAGSSALLLAGFMGGVEAGIIVAVRIAASKGTEWPLTLMAVLAALFLALGVLEQYLAIWKTRSVEGISFLFCGIDAMGDVTSIVSVCFEPRLRILGLVMYAVEFSLWVGIFACGAYFRLVPYIRSKLQEARHKRHEGAAEPGITLREASSSTSVFRTPSQDIAIRSRQTNLPRGHRDSRTDSNL